MNTVVRATVELLGRNNTRCSKVLQRRCTTSTSETTGTTTATPSSSSTVRGNVPGLSKKTVDVPAGGVGFPDASKKGTYKNPEYFCYHNASYFEAEVEMMKYRLPQPSNKVAKN